MFTRSKYYIYNIVVDVIVWFT